MCLGPSVELVHNRHIIRVALFNGRLWESLLTLTMLLHVRGDCEGPQRPGRLHEEGSRLTGILMKLRFRGGSIENRQLLAQLSTPTLPAQSIY
jgi:hypothetical protein